YRIPIILTAAFLAWFLLDTLSGWTLLDDFKKRWTDDLDQIVSPATLMVALFVWYGEIAENCKKNLPKRLTVRFETIGQHNKRELVMLCVMAHLSDVADIRALGQQIARQMCGGKELLFRAPFVEHKAGKPLYNRKEGHFMYYEVTFTLNERPSGIPEGKYKLWQAPFSSWNLQLMDNN
ncbi:MAG: hypothetical protein ACXV9T_13350, partial [Methylobacter sp.]